MEVGWVDDRKDIRKTKYDAVECVIIAHVQIIRPRRKVRVLLVTQPLRWVG
jgi:hypothetical protein